jgi:hypothetical protein
VKRHKLEAFVQVSLHDGRLMATLDTVAQAEATVLDGYYVLETDVPQTALAAQAVHDRYRDVEDYFCIEASADIRHEFYQGAIFAMAGVSRNHNRIAGNVFAVLRAALRNTPGICAD